MTEKIKQKIVQWIFDNRQYHTPIGNVYDPDAAPIDKDECVWDENPYVNSLELEKFIKSLNEINLVNVGGLAVLDYINKNGRYSPVPPEADLCKMCHKWEPFPKGQEHFGYAWWVVCKDECQHKHHKGERWSV